MPYKYYYLCRKQDTIMNDREVFSRLQTGDENAYKKLFIKYYAPLREYASQYVLDKEAEEIVQDLMLHIWEAKENIFIENAISTYLFSSTKNRCLNAIRRNMYHERVHNVIYEKLKAQFEDPDYYMISELSRTIETAIEQLPESYRETFKLSRFGELTNTQIANKLGVSIKTVEYRITQSLKILRAKLKDYLYLVMFLFY